MFIVKVLAVLSPIWTHPIGVVPVFADQAFTMRTPSRYRSQVVADPTVPHSSTACHPEPSATPELSWVPETSERRVSVLVEETKALMMGPFDAVRSRNRSTLLPDARLTFALRQACG